MAHRIAKFEKVSFDEYDKTIDEITVKLSELNIHISRSAFVNYDEITIPHRATGASAGYDIYSGMSVVRSMMKLTQIYMDNDDNDCVLEYGYNFLMPTFIKCRLDPDWVLKIYPKSGLAVKKRVNLLNSVGIIDADYYNNSSNEGHIFIPLFYPVLKNSGHIDNNGDPLKIEKNTKLVQGIFLPYGITEDDNCEAERTGGFGSTGIN